MTLRREGEARSISRVRLERFGAPSPRRSPNARTGALAAGFAAEPSAVIEARDSLVAVSAAAGERPVELAAERPATGDAIVGHGPSIVVGAHTDSAAGPTGRISTVA
jgi:hypothetical protein